jgi:thiol-disulfide isomerase/thioredoxin
MKKLLFMIATATLLACGGNTPKAETEQTEATQAETEKVTKVAEEVFVKSIESSLTGEDAFKAVVANYKGKPVLVDFWATWCPPCRAAMKTIIPVKEAFAEEIAFVYITGPSSPEETWKEMIKDIHGDHYYVTEEQWNTLLDQFESQGIPTYIIVDKDGNVMNKYIGFPGEEIIKAELETLTK